MKDDGLRTLKEVTDVVGRSAHRVIHLCEAGLVCPSVGAEGRGSVRRFCRDDVFRVKLALELQDAGVQARFIRPIMDALDQFLQTKQIQRMRVASGNIDLVTAVQRLGSEEQPVLAWLTPPFLVTMIAPKLRASLPPDAPVSVRTEPDGLAQLGTAIVANLTRAAVGL